jgi:hypothetical protein
VAVGRDPGRDGAALLGALALVTLALRVGRRRAASP